MMTITTSAPLAAPASPTRPGVHWTDRAGRSAHRANRRFDAPAPIDVGVPGVAALRRAQLDEADALTAFYESLDPESRQRRFLQPQPRVSPNLAVQVLTPPNEVVVAVDRRGIVVGEVVFAPARRVGGHAEIAYAVAPGHRRQGLARRLVHEVLVIAVAAGVEAVEASIGGDNRPSIALMRSLGATIRFDDGLMVAHLDLRRATRSAVTPLIA